MLFILPRYLSCLQGQAGVCTRAETAIIALEVDRHGLKSCWPTKRKNSKENCTLSSSLKANGTRNIIKKTERLN